MHFCDGFAWGDHLQVDVVFDLVDQVVDIVREGVDLQGRKKGEQHDGREKYHKEYYQHDDKKIYWRCGKQAKRRVQGLFP
jgi:hypothetical protein